METLSGYRLCCNPEHRQEWDYELRGPVWHKISDWPPAPVKDPEKGGAS